MLGEGGLQDQEVEGADRWKEYGDVQWHRRCGIYPHPDQTHLNPTTTFKPRNSVFQQALTATKEANPNISPYVWEFALKLTVHPIFAAEQVAMVIEVRLYLEEVLKFRKTVHCHYKITRAPHLASLAQVCRKYAKNSELAFDTQRQVDADAGLGHSRVLSNLP